MNSNKFGLELLNAEDEERVTEIIEKIESVWNVSWKPHGTERNYSIARNQAVDPIASFVELPVNSIDSILTKRYRQQYGDEYDPSHNLTNAETAVDFLFDDEIDEEIEVIADGKTGETPNLIVRDTGGGQPPEHFEERFLQLAVGSQIKYDWPFTQGRFKMGGSAVLPKSGDKGYKLILSAGFGQPEKWSWSIIRDNREEGYYEFLTVDGSPPTFTGKVRGQSSGTFIKVYEYQTPRKSNITAGFRTRFDREFVDAALPITFTEKRDYESAVGDVDTQGLATRLKQPRVERHIQLHRTFPHDFGEPFGVRDIEVVVFKDNKAIKEQDGLSKRTKDRFVGGKKHREQAVFFLVNGQTHAYERQSFLTGERGCQYRQTGEDVLVFMDLSDFADKEQHDRADFHELFKPSRDRMSGTGLAERLVEELKDALINYQPLQDEEQRRRQRVATSERKEQEEEYLQKLVDRDPSITRYLLDGHRAKVLGLEQEDEEQYNAPFLPDSLAIVPNPAKPDKIWSESKGPYEARQAVNKNTRVYFALNASNDYFTRDQAQGEFTIEPSDVFKQRSLNNGMLTLTLQPPSDVDPGDTKTVTVTISPAENGQLQESFTVEYLEPEDPSPSEGNGEKSQQTRVNKSEWPNMIEVYQEGGEDVTTWDELGWDEDDPPVVELASYSDEMDIFINMDAAPHQRFVTRNDLDSTGKEHVAERWKIGVAVNSLAMYHEFYQEIEENGHQTDPANLVPVAMRGMAETMLNQIISDSELKRFKAGA